MPSLETLFHNHLADLKNVIPGIGDIFICPMCSGNFIFEDIHRQKLSVGHVWPKYIREKSGSQIAAQQVVLLCKDCNSRAGSQGDRQMQLREEIKDAEKAGRFHGERRVQIILSPGDEPITLKAAASMQVEETITGQVTFAMDDATGKWKRNNPKEQERFLSIEPDSTFSMLIYPHHELKPNLPEVGWLTSAYLLAFHTFGYRYICHESLEPIREYILCSFEKGSEEKLELPDSDAMRVQQCNAHFSENPQIGIVMPTDGKTPTYLEVSFLDYHIWLSFRFVPHILEQLIFSVPEIYSQLPEITESGASLYAPIVCNKSDGHDCGWDYVLGKPLPA